MQSTVYVPEKIERHVSNFWKEKKIPDKIVKMDWKRPKFYLLDGPPYVNGVPHVGHAKTTIFKDIWGKFKYMQGYGVWFQPGFDCGGLPIENKVEELLGIKSKTEIETKIGVDKFIEECKKFAMGNEKVWLDFYKKIGAWRGWLKPYLTSENYYLESGWWTVKKWYEKGLLVEGKRPGFWCPHCETVLAGIEVSESYKNIEDPSIYVKFPVKGRKNEYLLVFTTTPWTLPANVAILAHPDEKYVKVEVNGEKLILAEKRLVIFDEFGMKYKVVEKFQGKKLEGLRYEPVLNVPLQKNLQKERNAHQVLLSVPVMLQRVASKTAIKRKISKKTDEFGHVVTMDVGTGLVHTAPGHGDVDNRIGKHYNLPEPSPVDEKGRLTEEAGEFAGIFVKDADPLIIEKLRKENKLLYSGRIVHSYPLCWRCKTPLIYRMSRQWFLKIDMLRDKIIKAVKQVNWLPKFAGERYYNIILEAPDWAVTRQRYWGIPLPVWTCEKCGSKKVIGSVKELKKEAINKIPDNLDLHKNHVDKIKLRCECGGIMVRDPDIMDVWFDSGISPWASLGYPFRNKELFEKLWDVDLVDESQDQVRAWFNTLMICSFATFDQKPYKTVCLNGWTLDEKGEKMSKSLGNVIFAEDAYKELGGDLMRLYITSDVAPWQTQKFSMSAAKDMRRVLNVLWNTCNFIKTYSDPNVAKEKIKNCKPEDIWILSKINTLIKDVTDNLEKFKFHYASRSIIDFILNDFSRWYIKIIRDRVSPEHTGPDKKPAQASLYYVLDRLVRLIAPITPFISDAIYTEMLKFMNDKESVHLCEWPQHDEKKINKKLEEQMEIIKTVVEAINSVRQDKKIKLRWPVKEVFIYTKDDDIKSAIVELEEIVKILGNTKYVKFQKVKKMKEFEGFSLNVGDVLYEEAFIRELIRNVQMLRKKNGLKIGEKISLYLKTDEKTEKIIREYKKELMKGVGATRLKLGIGKSIKGMFKFQEKEITIGFEKIK